MSKRMADDKYLDSLFERVEALEPVDDFDKYVLATDADFSGTTNGNFTYIGTDDYVIVPAVIKGITITSCKDMFKNSIVKGVALEDSDAITKMMNMFYSLGSHELELKYFKTNNVDDMTFMFYGSNLTILDLSSFNTEKVKYMHGIFQNCINLEQINLMSFDTKEVTTMGNMFQGCSNLEQLDLSFFNTEKVSFWGGMFKDCSLLENIDISSFTHESAGASPKAYMFQNIHSNAIIYVKNANELSFFQSGTDAPVGVTFQIK